MDVDGLKKINDTYGHLVGSRAICRLADILKMNSRTIDTAARYGGDEFVLVLADAPEREAMLVAQRIQEVMQNDAEDPKISASIGIAVIVPTAAKSKNCYQQRTRICMRRNPAKRNGPWPGRQGKPH